MKRILATLVLATALVACGGDKDRIAYRPIAFGEHNQCYYVHDPAEAVALQRAGLCESGWVPTVMPMAWRSMYYPYYSSPAYYDLYVPRPVRTVYVRSQKDWGSQNRSQIATAAKGAQYRGSNGKTVSADQIGATKYGAGNRFGPKGTKFGGGDRATTPAPPSAPASETKTQATSGGGSDGGTKATTKATSKPASPKPPAVKSPKPPSAPKPPSRPSTGGGSKSFGGGSRSSGSRR